MNEFKYPQKDDDLKKKLNNNADLIGSGISGVLTLLFPGDPIVGAFTGTAGTLVSRIFKGIGKEFRERQLSSREDIRVGKVLAITALEIHQRIENGESPRNDGFFDKKPTGRSDAEEVAEAIMLKCQREPQEKKIEYMGYLLASIAFDPNYQRGYGPTTRKISRRTDLSAILHIETCRSEKSFWIAW